MACSFLRLIFAFFIVSANAASNILLNRKHCQKPPRFHGPTFKIALFADLHYGENAWEEWGSQQDFNSTRVMSFILDMEKPDLVIFLGDVVTANNLPLPNATKYWDEAVAATEERNIPWVSVFGNHDDMPFEWPLHWFQASGIPGMTDDYGTRPFFNPSLAFLCTP